MAKDKISKKAEMVPGTLDMLIMKTLERNREPMLCMVTVLHSTSGGPPKT